MTRERWHGVALVLATAMVPVGEGVALGALALLAVTTAARWRELDLAVLGRPPAALPLSAFGVWLLLGAASVVVGGEGLLKPGDLGIWLPLLALPLALVAAGALPPRWVDRAVTAFAIMLTVACVFALVQFGLNVRPGESIARVASTVASQGRIPGDFDHTAAGGFYFHRLKMAHVLLVGLALLVARQLFGTMTLHRRLLEIAAIALFSATLLFTYARGALLAAGVGCAVCLLWAPRRWRLAAVAAVVVAVGAAVSVPTVRGRLSSALSAETSAVRGLIWSQGVRIIADHPLGVGLGNYPTVVNRYYDAADPHFDIRTYPHSMLIAAWAETGPAGLAAYLAGWAAVAVGCVRTLRRRRGAEVRSATAAGAGLFGVTALWVVGLTHDVLFHKPVAIAYALLAGLCLAVLARGGRPSPEVPGEYGEKVN